MAESPFIREVTTEDFSSFVLEGSHQQPVLVDFWAEWCAPCRTLLPLLAKIVDELGGKLLLAKVNTEEQQELAVQFGIRSLPTVKLFKNGQPVDEFMGALPESDIRAFLDRHIVRESDGLLLRAKALLEQGKVPDAAALIQQARQQDPANPRVQLAYIRVKAIDGDLDAAEAAINALPQEVQEQPEIAAIKGQMSFDRIAREAPPVEALEKALQADPSNSEARYELAAHRMMEHDHEAALELLYTLMLQDRTYGDDVGRKAMLLIFDILGGGGELVTRYRSKMFNALH